MSRIKQLLGLLLAVAIVAVGIWKTGAAACSTDDCKDFQANHYNGSVWCHAYEELRCDDENSIYVKDPDHDMKCEDQEDTIEWWRCTQSLCTDLCPAFSPSDREHQFDTTHCDPDDLDGDGNCWAYRDVGVVGCNHVGPTQWYACENASGGSQ